jgi:preprotein translocase subunit SecD
MNNNESDSMNNLNKINFRINNDFGNEEIILNGNDIIEIKTRLSINDNIDILFKLTDNGKKIISETTRENIGKNLYLYFDNLLLLSPMILMEINSTDMALSLGNDAQNILEYLIENNVFSIDELENINRWVARQ